MPVEIRIDPTPNPNSLKFTVSTAVAPRPSTFANPAAAEQDPLAKKLFAIDGVRSVFMINNFVTVTTAPEADWSNMVSPRRP